ncbi:MAG TPA: DinB family protein [Chitinophagaceae bacterium]|nr:DinB family protein [Chitinophagaceae bacterium]
MNQVIDTIKNTRQHLLQLVSNLSTDQLNKIPEGFNNNIIWNLSHMVAAQQGVCYLRAGVPLRIDEAFYLRYKPETKPESFVDSAAVEMVKKAFFTTLDQFVTDNDAGLFANYKPWKTRYGNELQTIDDAAQFLLFHEGLHVGYVMALKHLVKH